MSTFAELTDGNGLAAQRVANFFKDICSTFSPVSIRSFDQALTSSETELQDHPSSTTERSRHTALKRSSSSLDPGSPINSKKPKRVNLIVVVHLLPTLPAYLRALQYFGNIKVIIFKGPPENDRPAHMNEMARWVEGHYLFQGAVKKTTKNDLKSSDKVIELLSDAAGNGEEILIMDIGGYFAPSLLTLSKPPPVGRTWKLLGIVEDTENGHQKYHSALESLQSSNDKSLKYPNIYSVARSRMKMTEDYNVGKSLVRAADTILRQSLDHRLEDHRVIGVLGFGKIGSSIAMHLRQQHIGTVIVYDVNPEIMLRAHSHDFVISTKEQMLQQASFIFCATGNKAINYIDLMNIGPNISRLIIASCTSADDELDIHEGFKRHKNENDSTDLQNFSRYKFKRLNGECIEIILLCDGNAVNFSHRAVLGESIRSVQAAMVVCALKLQRTNNESCSTTAINTLTNEEEMRIARLWLQHFSQLDVHLITNVVCAHMKFDKISIEEAFGDLPVDQVSIEEIKKHMGLEKTKNIDSIDFMDSKRKLLITSPRGSGKTAVLFDFIHNVRNYYDLIWWFDCNDSLDGTLLSLAHAFHISPVERSASEIQTAVLEAVFSSLAINNILLVVDNVHEIGRDSAFEINIKIPNTTSNTGNNSEQCNFRCHAFLGALNEVLDRMSRRQRRSHIVALYTDDSDHTKKLLRESSLDSDVHRDDWHYLVLKDVVPKDTSTWVMENIRESSPATITSKQHEQLTSIISKETRRLTIRLISILMTIDPKLLLESILPKETGTEVQSNEQRDILPDLIKAALTKIKKQNESFYLCAQVASLIHTINISRKVFNHIRDILSQNVTIENGSGHLDETTWENIFTTFKKYCILRQNFLVPILHTRLSQRYIPPEYVEVYNMSSAYVRALSESLFQDPNSDLWKYALELIRKGFDYDYYDLEASKYVQDNEQNITHYLDHALTIIKHTNGWQGTEKHAVLRAELLCRLGSYYLNERRMYSEATESYSKAATIFRKLSDDTAPDDNRGKSISLSISKWHSVLMMNICCQLSNNFSENINLEFITRIKEARTELTNLSIESNQAERDMAKRYEIEATIAIARINVYIARQPSTSETVRNEMLKNAKEELEAIWNDRTIRIRTRSLLLQTLGSIHSLLEEYKPAMKCYRAALKFREKVCSPEHLDIARVKYRLASCIVQSISRFPGGNIQNNSAEVKGKLTEAQLLCQEAFTIQKTRLSMEHSNLKECSGLRQRIDELLKTLDIRKSIG